MTASVNMPVLSVEKTTDLLSHAYCTAVNNGGAIKDLPSVMLWGPPGVGKSQAVRQIARDIEARTGKRTAVTDVRLLLFNPIDLRGIPTANADKTLAIWLRPQIFQMDDSEELINILFLDEISAAPASVQAAAYQITLDRVVGEHKLPDNCIVIAAGNRVTDKSVSFKMPKALANRLLHIEVAGSFDSWKTWAEKSGIHPFVHDFLCFSSDKLFGFDPKNDDLAFATPRSWEMVSRLLCTVSDDVSVMYPLIAGLIGAPLATEFRAWCLLHRDLPDIPGVFNGCCTLLPKNPDALYATINSMVTYAAEHRNDLTAIEHSLRYAAKMPADYVALLLKRYEDIEEGYPDTLRTLPAYLELTQKRGVIRNGHV